MAEQSVFAKGLGADRLTPYVGAANEAQCSPREMYDWNIAMSGAFYEALARLEVVVRNALAEQLRVFVGAVGVPWYEALTAVLSPQANEDIANAKRRLQERSRPVTDGRVVAELSFGFWRYLLAAQYESALWTPALRQSFPNLKPQRRGTAHDAMASLHVLRNRIAHLEPIYGRDLDSDWAVCLQVVSWVDPRLEAWCRNVGRVSEVLSERPGRP